MARYCVNILEKAVLVLANILVVVAEWNTKDYMKKDHSLVKPYQDDHWQFAGSTIVTNNHVRLTAEIRSSQGCIWNTAPLELRDWELHLHFKVHGTARDLFGDGFAIWYAKERLQLGPVFGSKDFFQGLGIFVDTYANQNGHHHHGHPYISSMVNNGSLHYDHDLDGTHTSLSGCEANVRGASHETYIAIRYERERLTVSTDLEGKNAWKLCFAVDGVRLPTGYYLGVSAATGDLSDNHDIISLKLYDIGVERKDEAGVDYSKILPSADQMAEPRERVEDPKGWSGLKIFLYIILAVVIVGAIVGFLLYMKSQETSRKRFY